jgi:hypothetical protein
LAEAVQAAADVVILLRPLPEETAEADADDRECGWQVFLDPVMISNGPLSRLQMTFCNHQA